MKRKYYSWDEAMSLREVKVLILLTEKMLQPILYDYTYF